MTNYLEQGPEYPPSLHTGRHHGRAFLIILIVILIHVWFYFMYAMGWIFQPNAVLDSGNPIRTQVDFSIIPALPDDLAIEYDAMRDAQLAQLTGEEEGTMSIEDAMAMALEIGFTVREGDVVINEDTSDDLVVGNDRKPGDGIGVADELGG